MYFKLFSRVLPVFFSFFYCHFRENDENASFYASAIDKRQLTPYNIVLQKRGRSVLGKKRAKQTDAVTVFTGFGLILFLCAYPCFLRDHYFSMTRAKTLFFYGITVFFAVGCLVVWLVSRKQTEIRLIRKNPAELFLALFMASAVVSCVAAESPKDSLIGAQGRFMGLLTFLFIWVAYLCISRFGRLTTPVAVIFGVSVIGMCLIALLQFAGLNPFHLYDRTKDTVKSTFIALLGNKDVYYSYLALAVPFSMYLSFNAESVRESVFWHAVSFFGFTSVFACRSEGVVLFIIPVFLILFFLEGKNREGMLVFLRNVALLFAAALLIRALKQFHAPLAETDSMLIDLLTHPLLAAAVILICAALYLVFMRVGVSAGFFRTLRIIAAVLVGAAVCAAIGGFVYFTFIDKTTDIGAASKILRYNNAWGSSRGFAWTRLTRLYFKKFTLLQKLVGSGEETVGLLMDRYFKEDMKKWLTVVYDNAHNEYLQYLITLGLVGLLSYLFFAGNAIRSGFQEGDRFRRAAALACVCYMAQSFINISQALTTPLFFVFLALTQTQGLDPAGGKTQLSSAKKIIT